jgi:glycosyltransferase involved in cell wall biosynthesis
MVGDMDDRKAFLHEAFYVPQHRITASSFVRQIFHANGFDAPITVQAYGHDISWLNNYAGKTESEHIRIGFIGELDKHKGVHLLLQAARSLPSALFDRFSISIYGDLNRSVAYGDELRALAADMPNVDFCGTYPHEQSGEVFARIDVLVVPSLWYDFPLIIHEAFATHTPVISTNLGGMAETVIHDVNGLLFERGNVAELASHLSRFIIEPELLLRLQEGAPTTKTVADEVSELETIYYALQVMPVR